MRTGQLYELTHPLQRGKARRRKRGRVVCSTAPTKPTTAIENKVSTDSVKNSLHLINKVYKQNLYLAISSFKSLGHKFKKSHIDNKKTILFYRKKVAQLPVGPQQEIVTLIINRPSTEDDLKDHVFVSKVRDKLVNRVSACRGLRLDNWMSSKIKMVINLATSLHPMEYSEGRKLAILAAVNIGGITIQGELI